MKTQKRIKQMLNLIEAWTSENYDRKIDKEHLEVLRGMLEECEKENNKQ